MQVRCQAPAGMRRAMNSTMAPIVGPRLVAGAGRVRLTGGQVVITSARNSRRVFRPQAIGFDFGDREAEPVRANRKKMSTLGTLGASLLVLSPVMKGAVAEAFLQCLGAAQKYQASNRDVLAAFTKFYGLLLSAGYDSWQDYLLDQVFMGRDNTLARAVAQGSLEDGAPILAALAHDLDVLQTMAVSLSEVAEYVGESAPFVGPEWVAAASATAIRRPTKALSGGSPPRVEALNLDTRSAFITRPPTPDELTAWKDSISSKELWGQAVPVVRQYWHLHGFGITSRNAVLRWTKGALEEGPDPLAPPAPPSTTTAAVTAAAAANLGPLSALEPQRASLAENTERHVSGKRGASHALIMGPSGTGKTWLAWDSTLAAGRERGLRLVDLSGADAATIVEAARGCGRYPRLRFILVADHIDLPLRGSAAAELMSGLTSAGPGGWPSNTLLYLVASPTSTVHLDPVVTRFQLTVTTDNLSKAQFGATIKEMVVRRVPGTTAADVPEDTVEHAAEWANKVTGGLTVRSASAYLDKFLEA